MSGRNAANENLAQLMLVGLTSDRPFTLLSPVLNQSFSNGSNADKAPNLIDFTVQLATSELLDKRANNRH
jgi:hypothetical protein